MQMHIAGVILSSLVMVQAWQVTFYRELFCDGERHTMTGTGSLPCGSPRGAPLKFDAKSVSISHRGNCAMTFFTDNNSRCNSKAPARPVTVEGPYTGPLDDVCLDLDPGKQGKWKNLSVSC